MKKVLTGRTETRSAFRNMTLKDGNRTEIPLIFYGYFSGMSLLIAIPIGRNNIPLYIALNVIDNNSFF